MRKFVVYFSFLAFAKVSPIAGRGTWNASVGNYGYYASPSKTYKSYNSSLEECRRMDGDLALITSAEIQSFLNNLVTSESLPYAFYLGLQDLTKDGTFVWDDGEALGYTNWATSQPSSVGVENCVVAGDSYTYHDDLKWNDDTCDGKGRPIGFFCQRIIGKIWASWGEWSDCSCPGQRQRVRNCTDSGRPGPDSCTTSGEQSIENRTCWTPECNITTPAVTTTAQPPGRGNWFVNGSFEYYVSVANEAFAYEMSQKKCQDEDGELALVKSPLVQSFISSLVSNGSGFPYGFYIGLKYDHEKNGFFWSDGSPLEYNHWQFGEPNRKNNNNSEDCVGVGYKYGYMEELPWYDYACDVGNPGPKGRVCQRRIGWHWSEWSNWTNCNCSLLKERTRNCTYSQRAGPDTCTRNSTLVTESRNCSISDISCVTTETSKDITTLGYITTSVTESEKTVSEISTNAFSSPAGETTVSEFLTNAFSSSAGEIEEEMMPFIIPIAAACAGVLLLVVSSVTAFCLLKRKSTEKNKESQDVVTNSNAMDGEYETIPRKDSQDKAEGEYETMGNLKQQPDSEYCTLDCEGAKARFKTPGNEQTPDKTPAKSDDGKVPLDHTQEYKSELHESESDAKDESEYTIMKPPIRLHSAPKLPSSNGVYATMHVANEVENKEIVNMKAPIQPSSGDIYATVTPKSVRYEGTEMKGNIEDMQQRSPSVGDTYAVVKAKVGILKADQEEKIEENDPEPLLYVTVSPKSVRNEGAEKKDDIVDKQQRSPPVGDTYAAVGAKVGISKADEEKKIKDDAPEPPLYSTVTPKSVRNKGAEKKDDIDDKQQCSPPAGDIYAFVKVKVGISKADEKNKTKENDPEPRVHSNEERGDIDKRISSELEKGNANVKENGIVNKENTESHTEVGGDLYATVNRKQGKSTIKKHEVIDVNRKVCNSVSHLAVNLTMVE